MTRTTIGLRDKRKNQQNPACDATRIFTITIILVLGFHLWVQMKWILMPESDMAATGKLAPLPPPPRTPPVPKAHIPPIPQPKVAANTRAEISMSARGKEASSKNSDPSVNMYQVNNHIPPSHLDPSLPQWIRNYITWHREMRTKYPGDELFTNSNAPNILVRTCLGLCGGLHDRLGQLPWDLYLANQTGRVLFLRWYRPKPIEDFLVPTPAFNWSMPPNLPGWERMQKVKEVATELFQDLADDAHPEEAFWATHLDKALDRAINGEFKSVKLLRHRILGHINEEELERRLRALGETDMIHTTLTFGKLFFLFFQPAPAIEMELEDVYTSLKISPGKYSAVHCRVRHPKAFSRKIGLVKGKWDKYPADKTGLPWEGQTRQFAVETATEALQCAKMLVHDLHEPIYFFSDSNDLVRYFSRELSNSTLVKANHTILQEKADWNAYQEVQSSHVVARDVDMENAHIDKQKGRSPPAYYGTFIDLFLAINARCVTFGVGYYAVFATKISGTKCKQLYTEEAWGGSENKRLLADVCKKRESRRHKVGLNKS